VDLYEAFALKPAAIVAIVGGGGKTSLAHALAREAAGRGLSAVVLTTTRFTRPPHMPMPLIVQTTDMRAAKDLALALAPGTALVAITGHGEHGRMLGFLPETVDALANLGAGLIVVEADGSRQRPFKAPAAHEPVIPRSATDVIVCVGLDVLGKPLAERDVHRSETVSRLGGGLPGEAVDAALIVNVLLHADGGRKGVPPGARLHALLNAPASAEHEKLGVHIAQRLVFGGYRRAVVANAQLTGDVRAVLQ
jgi:molybdenum cofactor cytidylyltransferase